MNKFKITDSLGKSYIAESDDELEDFVSNDRHYKTINGDGNVHIPMLEFTDTNNHRHLLAFKHIVSVESVD